MSRQPRFYRARSIVLLTVAIGTTCSSVLHAQIGISPEVGLGMSSMHFAPALGFTAASTGALFSWKAGANIDYGFNKHIYIQAGLFAAQKGQKRNFSFYTNDTLNQWNQQTLTIYYADLPINIVFKTGMQGKGRFIAGLGSTPSYIIGGRNQLRKEERYHNVPVVNNYNLSIGPGNPLGLFDIGLSLLAGYELPTGLYFKAYYTASMTDIGLGGEIDKNRMWGIAAGYIFGKGRNINKEADDLIDRTPEAGKP